MNPIKIIFPLFLLFVLFSCKKNKTDGDYFYGKWDVMERTYHTLDTSYTDTLQVGALSYSFKTNMTVEVVNPGIANVTDSWKVAGANKDSIDFAMMTDWQILEKDQNGFKAKSYTDANSYFVLKLVR